VIDKKKISEKDEEIWDEYVKNPTGIFDKDQSLQVNNLKKNRFKFDLHGYTLISANKKVKEIIVSCFENNYQELLLITGKGIHSNNNKDIYSSKDFGKIKYSVQEFINSDPDLSPYIKSVSTAEKKDGGEGAIIIKLKRL